MFIRRQILFADADPAAAGLERRGDDIRQRPARLAAIGDNEKRRVGNSQFAPLFARPSFRATAGARSVGRLAFGGKARQVPPEIKMNRPPRISFVSLGCPKALVDSERIITRLRAEGYELCRDHADADLAIVNTCGFLDSAQAESLAAIGEALAENGKVVVTGCMGAEPEKITRRASERAGGHRPAAI